MKVEYKFNKSSEARDCFVESVKLFIESSSILKTNFTKNVNLDIEWIKSETKQFTFQQQLKDYINTVQEPIEFIAESSIDDVLMKEWIGEWKKPEKHCKFCDKKVFGLLCENRQDLRPIEKTNECDIVYTKTGSPKLNSNWIFKIEVI